jgi:hypothetical protein
MFQTKVVKLIQVSDGASLEHTEECQLLHIACAQVTTVKGEDVLNGVKDSTEESVNI